MKRGRGADEKREDDRVNRMEVSGWKPVEMDVPYIRKA